MAISIDDLAKKDYELSKTNETEDDYKSIFKDGFKLSFNKYLKTLPKDVDHKDALIELKQTVRQQQEATGQTFIDASGHINQSFETLVINAAKNEVVEKYEKSRNSEIKIKSEEVNKKAENKKIDLNTSEGKKEFINNLYKGYSECKTRKDKRNYIEDNFGISFDGMTEKQVDHVISAFDLSNDVMRITEELKAQNSNLKDDESETLAIKKYAERNAQNVEIVKAIHNDMKLLNELQVEKAKLKRKGQDISDLDKRIQEIGKKLSLGSKELEKNQEENENKVENAGKLNNEDEYEKIEEKLDISDNFLNEEIAIEQDEDISDLFDFEESNENVSDLFDIEEEQTKNDEDISNLFDVDVGELEDNSNTTIEKIIKESKINTNVNSIIANVPEEDFEQSYEEIKENPVLRFFKDIQNRLTQKKLTEGQAEKVQHDSNELKQEDYTQDVKPSFFERAKNVISKLIHKNKENTFQIDTAESNTKTEEMRQEGSWELSNYGTSKEEVIQNTIIAREQSKQRKNENGKATKIESGESISM